MPHPTRRVPVTALTTALPITCALLAPPDRSSPLRSQSTDAAVTVEGRRG